MRKTGLALGEPLVDDDLIRNGLWTAKAAVTPCFSAALISRDYQEIEDASPRPRHLARRPRHHPGLRPTRYARSAGSSPRASAVAAPHHIDAWHGWSLDVEADGRSATVRAPGPGHRHHLDRHRHSQDRAHLTPPDHPAREGPDQRTHINMTQPTANELRPLTRSHESSPIRRSARPGPRRPMSGLSECVSFSPDRQATWRFLSDPGGRPVAGQHLT